MAAPAEEAARNRPGSRPHSAVQMAGVARETPRRPGTFRVLLTNVKIAVNGDSATADVIWTGVNSASVKAQPQILEQGREQDALVKRDGHWYFKRRVITTDGGLPAMFEKTYRKR